MKIAIIGFPRSGTQYTARLFTHAGIKLGHEHREKDGTVSWKELPNTDEFDTVLLQVRHPLDTISSAETIQNASVGHMVKLLDFKSPDTYSHRTELLMALWLEYTKQAEEKAHSFFQVEELPEIWNHLLNTMNKTYRPMPNVRTNINTRKHDSLNWSTLHRLNPDLTRQLHYKASHYGYI